MKSTKIHRSFQFLFISLTIRVNISRRDKVLIERQVRRIELDIVRGFPRL